MSLKGNATALQKLRGKINGLTEIYYDTYQIAVKNGFKGTVDEWLLTIGNHHIVEFDSLTDEQKAELKGESGKDGKDGADGYTPVKGTDYFTEADKEELKEETIGWANEFDVTSHVRITSYGQDQTVHKATDNGSTIVIHAEGALAEGSLYITGLTGTPVAMLMFYNNTVGVMTFNGDRSLEDFSCSQDLMVLDPETGEWVESFWSRVSGRFTFVLFYTADGIRMLKGKPGDKGESGESAYETAMRNGFAGTEQEWLDSLKGEPATKEEIEAAVAEYLKENPYHGSTATIGEVTLLASAWVGNASPYSQVVEIEGVTENSQVDLTPSIEQLAVFHHKDLAFVTENEDGVVTVYALGDKPENDYTIQVTITEVTV